MFIASEFAEDEILCNVPPHTLRIDLQARRFKSDVDSESAIVDSNDNGIPIEFVLLGFTPYYGNLGMRNKEEFIRIAYIGVTPNHRLLPPRCVTTTIISGKSSQKNFIGYFQTLFNNRINCASVITSTKFVTKSFNERNPVTGEDGAKINFNALEFHDRPAQGAEEEKLIADIEKFIVSSKDNVASALKSSIPGASLIELPFGGDHAALKAKFDEEHAALPGATGLSALPAEANPLASEPPEPKKKKSDLTDEQKAALKAAGVDF